jgi:uncharacterized protein
MPNEECSMVDMSKIAEPELQEVVPSGKSRRGFASMNKDRLKELAASGGRAAALKGTNHKWNSETAKLAARKGVLAKAAKRAIVVESTAETTNESGQNNGE